jgi:hypothetical protein
MALRLVRCAALASFALPVALRAHTMTEYAIQSGGSAMGGRGGSSIAVCKLDAVLLPRLSPADPRTTIGVAVVGG